MANDSHLGALSHWRRVNCIQIKKKDKQDLTLMTSFGNVVSWPKIWLKILHWEHCPTGGVFIEAKLKQIQTKSNPNDSHLRTLSVGRKCG